MTDTFNEGDLIEAAKGDTVIRGKAWNDCTGTLNIGGSGWSVERIEARGYVVTLIEKAAPALPTEPGVYQSRTGELWAIEGEGERLKWVGEDFIRADPNNYVPFIRLEPVADTAKKVINDIARGISGTMPDKVNGDRVYLSRNIDHVLKTIAEQNGATL